MENVKQKWMENVNSIENQRPLSYVNSEYYGISHCKWTDVMSTAPKKTKWQQKLKHVTQYVRVYCRRWTCRSIYHCHSFYGSRALTPITSRIHSNQSPFDIYICDPITIFYLHPKVYLNYSYPFARTLFGNGGRWDARSIIDDRLWILYRFHWRRQFECGLLFCLQFANLMATATTACVRLSGRCWWHCWFTVDRRDSRCARIFFGCYWCGQFVDRRQFKRFLRALLHQRTFGNACLFVYFSLR